MKSEGKNQKNECEKRFFSDTEGKTKFESFSAITISHII